MPSRLETMSIAEIRREATDLADDVLNEHWWQGELPVDPVQIARSMGVEVFSAQLGNDVFGMILGAPEGAQIYVDVDQPPTRYRFTAAHELGHYVERSEHGDGDMAYVDRRSDEDRGNKQEIYANQFAGALLMPEADILAYRQAGLSDVRLAARFGVSLSALQYRLQLLGA
jgi:Zn-dependent peptidase ImmA (M78 family)